MLFQKSFALFAMLRKIFKKSSLLLPYEKGRPPDQEGT